MRRGIRTKRANGVCEIVKGRAGVIKREEVGWAGVVPSKEQTVRVSKVDVQR